MKSQSGPESTPSEVVPSAKRATGRKRVVLSLVGIFVTYLLIAYIILPLA